MNYFSWCIELYFTINLIFIIIVHQSKWWSSNKSGLKCAIKDMIRFPLYLSIMLGLSTKSNNSCYIFGVTLESVIISIHNRSV